MAIERSGRAPRRPMLAAAAALALAVVAASPLLAQDRMALGVVTHFGQGWSLDLQAEVAALGATAIRDGINWTLAEPEPGRYDFSDSRTGFPGQLDPGLFTIVNFSYPNPAYDGGTTPHTDPGRQAQADFVAAVVDRFPEIDAVEVGNEFNAQNFVSGTVKTSSYEERDEFYFAMLCAVYEAVKRGHPQVQVLGGATHSIPVAYLRDLFAHGALDCMDGLAIHPYTSQPEQLGDHLALLRAAMGPNPVPIHVTEFSQEVATPAEAAPYLVKTVAVMAASGVASATWYALLEQPYYSNMGLLGTDRSLRPAARAFALMQGLLQAHGNPHDVSPDRLARVYQFGDRAAVLWGVRREVIVDGSVTAYDPEGNPVAERPLMLDEDWPLIVVGSGPIGLGRGYALGPTDVVGDSLFQFDVINDRAGPAGFEGPWSYFALNGEGKLEALYTRPGGDVPSEPWRPYIGHDWMRPLAVEPTSVTPVDFADGQRPKDQYSVVERFTATEAGTLAIEGWWQVNPQSEDGIVLTIVADGAEIYRAATRDTLAAAIPAVTVRPGSTIDFIVGVNANARGGDRTTRRITIRRAD